MALIAWDTPIFGTFLSSADMNDLRMRSLILDLMTLRGRRAWTDQVDELANGGGNPSPLCSASFIFRAGLTTLTIPVFGNNNGVTHTLRCRLNGVQQGTLNLTNTEQTLTVTLTGLGFTDGQLVEVELDVTRPGGAAIGVYAVRDMYVSPASALVTGSSPGVPTFGSLTLGNLEQLAAAQQWCFDRLCAIPLPVPQGFLYRSLHNWPSTRLAWRGGVARANGAGRLSAVLGYDNTNTPSERMRLLINEAEVATTPTVTTGQKGIHTFDVDLSGYPDEQLLRVRLEQIVTAQYPEDTGAIGTRWNLRWFETTASAWSFATAPAGSQPLENLTFSQLQARLNAIGAITTTATNRITGSTDMFNRIRCFRRSPTVDEFQRTWHAKTYVARSRRFTDTLRIVGKGVKLGWGPITIPSPEGQNDPYRNWKPAFEEDLIGGETVEEKRIAFDSFPGLVPGTMYFLLGEDIRYAAEEWQ